MAPARGPWRPHFPGAVRLALVLSLLLYLLELLPGLLAAAAPFDPLTISVGMHVRNIYGLSLADQTFKAEGWS